MHSLETLARLNLRAASDELAKRQARWARIARYCDRPGRRMLLLRSQAILARLSRALLDLG